MTNGNIDRSGLLADPHFAMAVIAVLVRRAGNTASIAQEDLDAVAFAMVREGFNGKGEFTLAVEERAQQ